MKKLAILFFIQLFFTTLQAQQVKYVASDKTIRESKNVKSRIVGSIDSLIYVATTNLKKSKNLRLSIYHKSNSAHIKTVNAKKIGSRVGNSLLKDAKYNDVIVNQNQVFIIWTVENKTESKLILQICDKELKEIQQPKIIYCLENNKKTSSNAHPFFLVSPDGNSYIIGGEECAVKGSNAVLQYKILNKEMTVMNSIKAELPYSLNIISNDVSSTLCMDNQGVLYFNTEVFFGDNSISKSRKEGNIIGKIAPDNSELKFNIISLNNKNIKSLKYEIFDDYLSVFGIYFGDYISEGGFSKNEENKEIGVFSLKLDKNSFTTMGEIHTSPISIEKIAYNDFELNPKEKNKYSIDEFAMHQLLSWNCIFSDYCKTKDNGMILTINSQRDRIVFDKNGDTYFTDLIGTYYVKINNEFDIKWLSCIQQQVVLKEKSAYISNKMIEKNGVYVSVLQRKKKQNVLCVTDGKSGLVIKTPFIKKHDREIKEVIDNQIYYIGLNKRVSTKGWIGAGTTISAMGVSAFIFPYVIPLEGMAAWAFTTIKADNVCFGKYEIDIPLNLNDSLYKKAFVSKLKTNYKTWSQNEIGNPILKKSTLFFPVFSLIRKEIAPEYEYNLTPKISAVAGAGIAFGDDYVEKKITFSSFLEGEELLLGKTHGENLSSLYYHTKFKSGFLLTTSLKFYKNKDESNSDFYSIRYKFVSRNYDLPNIIGSSSTNYSKNLLVNTNNHYFAIERGKSWCFNLKDRIFCHQILLGFGVKISRWDQIIQDTKSINVYTNVYTFIKNEGTKVTSISPYGFFQYRIGFSW